MSPDEFIRFFIFRKKPISNAAKINFLPYTVYSSREKAPRQLPTLEVLKKILNV